MKTKRKKKKKLKWQRCVECNIFFVLGFILFALGVLYGNTTIFMLGTVSVIIGVTKRQKTKPLTAGERRTARILIAALAIALFLGVVFLNFEWIRGQSSGCSMINDFESCAAAGNPVMESYPRQCRACDQTFMEKIERTDCTTDADCIVFGRDGDCNCGCYRVGSAPVQRIEGCFCAAPTSCECVNGECEGVFE